MVIFATLNLLAEPIKIGFIDSDIDETIGTHQETANYIGNQMGMSGGKVVVAENPDEISRMLTTGEIDIFIDSVFASLIVQDLAQSKIILRRWKKGVAEYKSIFIAAKSNSSLKDLSGLNGNVIGFSDEGSTSSRWIPQAILKKMGYSLLETENPGNNDIGFSFYDDDLLTGIDMLFSGRISIIAMSSDDFNELDNTVKSKLQIIGESFNVPRQLISVRSTMNNEMIKKLIAVFFEMNTTVEGQSVLQNWERTTKCDIVNKEILDSLSFSRELLRFMK